jgi:hypothetical protein
LSHIWRGRGSLFSVEKRVLAGAEVAENRLRSESLCGGVTISPLLLWTRTLYWRNKSIAFLRLVVWCLTAHVWDNDDPSCNAGDRQRENGFDSGGSTTVVWRRGSTTVVWWWQIWAMRNIPSLSTREILLIFLLAIFWIAETSPLLHYPKSS